jgi:hypothetical protein
MHAIPSNSSSASVFGVALLIIAEDDLVSRKLSFDFSNRKSVLLYGPDIVAGHRHRFLLSLSAKRKRAAGLTSDLH